MAIDTTTDVEADIDGDVVLQVTEVALKKVLEIREGEDKPDEMGLRVEVTGAYGVDYTYDLSFEEISSSAADDSVVEKDGLTVMVPADSVDQLRGATLDLPANQAQGGLVIRNPNRPNPLAGLDLELEGTLAEKVSMLLEKSVNPQLAAHGGYATLVGVDDETKKVYLTMGGGCQGCSMSAATLVHGIQVALLDALPEITEVIDATDHSAGENPFYD